MSQAPKFLLGGVNKWSNFLGLRTLQTATYGVAEVGVKVAPILAFIYGIRKDPLADNHRCRDNALHSRTRCILERGKG